VKVRGRRSTLSGYGVGGWAFVAWRTVRFVVIMVFMRRMSFVEAKAHLSELVDDAEHKHRPVLILRHGKPAAALVPVDLVLGAKTATPPSMKEDELAAFWSGFGSRDTSRSAVADLLEGRRRHER